MPTWGSLWLPIQSIRSLPNTRHSAASSRNRLMSASVHPPVSML